MSNRNNVELSFEEVTNLFGSFYNTAGEEVLINDDDYDEYYEYDEEDDQCSCCGGGGCPHCEPHRFIDCNIHYS